MKKLYPISAARAKEPPKGVGYKKPSSSVSFKPLRTSKNLRALFWTERAILRKRTVPKEEKERPCEKDKVADYFPMIHLDRGPDAWYNNWDVTRDGGTQKFYITNNGLKTSPLVVVETYETILGLYQIPVGDPYPAFLNVRGFIRNLHPGETRKIELEWNPDTTQPYTHFNVAAYDPVLDPRYPLNYHPSLFPDFHIKHNGHAVVRE